MRSNGGFRGFRTGYGRRKAKLRKEGLVVVVGEHVKVDTLRGSTRERRLQGLDVKINRVVRRSTYRTTLEFKLYVCPLGS